jgi:hypothetical protein
VREIVDGKAIGERPNDVWSPLREEEGDDKDHDRGGSAEN